MRGIGPVVFAVVFVGFWSAITLAFDVKIALDVRRATAAKSYAAVTGTITRSELETHYDSDGSTYSVDLAYVYEVDGQTYTSDRYRYGEMSTSSRANEQRVVNEHPVGREVTVRYNPANPSDAVLLVGVQGQDLFLMLFLTPFNIIMLGGWALCGEWLGRKVTKPPAGGVPMFKRRDQIRLRLPRYSAAVAAAGWALGLSFVSIFAVGIPFSFHPPMQVIVGVWVVIATVSLSAYARRRLLVGSGVKDLVIDDRAETVTLPRTFGRTQSVIVPMRDIAQIAVEKRVVQGDKSSSTYYEPTLVYRVGESQESAKIASWGNPERADALVAWLSDWLRLPAAQ